MTSSMNRKEVRSDASAHRIVLLLRAEAKARNPLPDSMRSSTSNRGKNSARRWATTPAMKEVDEGFDVGSTKNVDERLEGTLDAGEDIDEAGSLPTISSITWDMVYRKRIENLSFRSFNIKKRNKISTRYVPSYIF